MPEFPGRYVFSTASMAPAINSYALLYQAPTDSNLIYGVDVCNGGTPFTVPAPGAAGTGQDAHICIWIVPIDTTWVPGEQPSIQCRVAFRQRVECDGVDGNVWVSPVKHLNPQDRVVVLTDTPNVTFYGHGYRYTGT